MNDAIVTFKRGGYMTSAGFDDNGNPIWLNLNLALKELGHHIPKSIGISPPRQILEKAWRYWGPRIYANNPRSKPSWPKLIKAEKQARLKFRKVDKVKLLRREGERRIALNYTNGQSGELLEEWKVRQRGDATPAQDLERERLRGEYRKIRDVINAAVDEDVLLAVDFTSDGWWASSEARD